MVKRNSFHLENFVFSKGCTRMRNSFQKLGKFNSFALAFEKFARKAKIAVIPHFFILHLISTSWNISVFLILCLNSSHVRTIRGYQKFYTWLAFILGCKKIFGKKQQIFLGCFFVCFFGLGLESGQGFFTGKYKIFFKMSKELWQQVKSGSIPKHKKFCQV